LSRRAPGTTRSRSLCAVATLALVLLGLNDSARAIDLSAWVPGLRLTPFLAERIEYESNVFQTPSHSKDDLIFRTIPGFLVEYGAGPHWVTVGYRAEVLNFLSLSNLDAIHHVLLGQAHLEFNRLSFDLKDDFVRTTNPIGTELTGRVESRTNTFLSSAEYRLTQRFAVGANAGWTNAHFPTLPLLDRNEYLAGGSVFWKFLPKTDLQVNYNYGRKDFETDTSRDVTRHLVLAGLRGDLTAKLSSTFRIGYEDRQPQQDTAGVKGYRGLVGGGDWIYRPTDRLTITLTTDRSVQESFIANALYYVQTSGSLAVSQQFGPKLTANVRVSGGQNAYPTKLSVDLNNPSSPARFRKDTIIGWGAGVGYDIQRWLRVGLDYFHTTRDSNFNSSDFKDDRIAATVTLQL
jgi:hypothetical protein